MIRDRIREVLELDGWFSALPVALKDAIASQGVLRRHKANELLFATGDEPNGQFCLISGQINLVNNHIAGKQVTHSLHRPGSWFGYLSMLDNQPRFQDALSVGPTETLCLSVPTFRRIVRNNPEYFEHFALLLCGSVRLTLTMLVDSLTGSLSSRLASALLDMSPAQAAAPEAAGRAPRFTQELLAGLVGASRQTVNRQLRDWQARNIIRLGYGAVTVVDRAALAHAAQGDDQPRFN